MAYWEVLYGQYLSVILCSAAYVKYIPECSMWSELESAVFDYLDKNHTAANLQPYSPPEFLLSPPNKNAIHCLPPLHRLIQNEMLFLPEVCNGLILDRDSRYSCCKVKSFCWLLTQGGRVSQNHLLSILRKVLSVFYCRIVKTEKRNIFLKI